ncbi:MAG: PAS domain-containing protein [Acidobacteria bacterium]|nr:PAS domain-containing protein [Acidobacteriota bacterium]
MRNVSHASSSSSIGPSAASASQTIRLLWVGDSVEALRFVAVHGLPVHVSPSSPSSLAVDLKRMAGHCDGVVIDTAASSCADAALQAEHEAPDVPIVVLISPAAARNTSAAEPPGLSSPLVKTPDFMHHVLPVLASTRARLDLLSAFRGASEREARLRSMIDTMPAPVMSVEPSGRVLAANRASLELFGAEHAPVLVGQRLFDFVGTDGRGAVGDLLSGAVDRAAYALVRMDGQSRPVVARAAAFERQGGVARLIVFHEQSDVASLASVPDAALDEGWEPITTDDDTETTSAHPAQVQAPSQELMTARAELEEARRHLARATADLADVVGDRDRLTTALRSALNDLQRVGADAERWERAAAEARTAIETERAATRADRAAVEQQLRAETAQLQSRLEEADAELAKWREVPRADRNAESASHEAEGHEPTGAERRRHPRIAEAFEGWRLGLIDTPVQIQNLSIGGCFVASFYPPPSEPVYQVRIDLGAHGVVEVDVRTAYVSPEIGYGVQFMRVPEQARSSIAAAVAAGHEERELRGFGRQHA